jgi:hypothetical protein
MNGHSPECVESLPNGDATNYPNTSDLLPPEQSRVGSVRPTLSPQMVPESVEEQVRHPSTIGQDLSANPLSIGDTRVGSQAAATASINNVQISSSGSREFLHWYPLIRLLFIG